MLASGRCPPQRHDTDRLVPMWRSGRVIIPAAFSRSTVSSGRTNRETQTYARSGRQAPSRDRRGNSNAKGGRPPGRECCAVGAAAPDSRRAGCARAPNMREAAGSLPSMGPTRGSLKVKRGRPPGRWMLCGWGCGGWLTSHVMRAHFTRCPNRPAVVPQVNSLDRRGKNSKAQRGRPPGRRMPCGWPRGSRLTASRMRAASPGCGSHTGH